MQGVLPEAWPDVLRTLAAFLCPFKAMQQRQQYEAAAAAAASAEAADGAMSAAGTGAAAGSAAALPPGGVAGSRPGAAPVHSTLLGRGLARYETEQACCA